MVDITYYSDADYEDVKRVLQECDLYDEAWEARENLQRKISRDPESILIANVDDKIVGCVFIVEDGWNAFIWRLSVMKDYRKQGIGTALMKKAEEIVRKRGINETSLFIDPKNKHLREWYEKQNYSKTTDWTFMYKKLK